MTWRIFVLAFYESFTVSLYMETEVYDFNAVVGSVGGSLGLFLGFSCYEYGKRLIDSLSIGWFQSRMSSTKTSTTDEVDDYIEEKYGHIDSGVLWHRDALHHRPKLLNM